MHQRGGGLALATAGDGLDLVGVGDVRHHVPAYKNAIDELLITAVIKMRIPLIVAEFSHFLTGSP